MERSVHLTVALCTHNRSALLRNTLQAFTRLEIPAGVTWEVVLVNNGSTDDTVATIADFRESLPLCVVYEPNLGKSNAANAAVGATTGEYILWTDDDVLVDPLWLHAYHAAFAEWPGDAFFGGPVEPRFEGTPPLWLAGALTHVGNVYAVIDHGPHPIPLQGELLPYGANMAMRASAQRQHMYDTRLGRRGTHLLAGEDWQVMKNMLTSGLTGRWVPGARTRHVIPPDRQTLRYVRGYYRGNGASLARVRPSEGEAHFLGRPRWLWREAISNEFAYRLRRFYAPSERWSENLKRAAVAWGMLQLGPRR